MSNLSSLMLDKITKLENELAEAKKDLEILDDIQADALYLLGHSRLMERQRDQWKDEAEGLAHRIGCGCGVDGPCKWCDAELEKFFKLKLDTAPI